MNHSANPNSGDFTDAQLLIEKLVDGELDHSTRSRWLTSLSDDSPLWRELAFAFVEKQVTDEALRELQVHETVPRYPDKNAIRHEHSDSGTATNKRRHWMTLAWIAGLAACLVAGIFIGLEQSASTAIPALVQNDGRESTDDSAQASTANPSIELAEALSRSVTPVPNEFRRALMKAGYSLQDKQTITSVSLPTGGQIKLPIRDVNVTYVGLGSFQ